MHQYCRLGRSTTHVLIAIQHKWMQTVDNKGFVRALFDDFKKAFDIVNHNILFSKLKNFNISHCLLKWFASYLFHRRQCVRVGSRFSSWKTLCGIMPQGSRLGPLSFIVMIDDLRADCEVHKIRRQHHLNSFTAEVDKSRLQGLGAAGDKSRQLGGRC